MAAPAKDLREWIALLEREGELRRISAEVDPDLEITEIVDRVVKAGGPALLFENPKGSQHPLLINQFGTERRMCLALGVEKLDDAAAKLGDVLDMQPPQGVVEKVKGLLKLKSVADSMPKTVSKGACQEIVLQGDDVDLGLLPIQRCWPGDPAPFITLPGRHHEGPEDGSPQRRHVPHAGRRQELDLHALADAQGRPCRPARVRGRADPGRGGDRARSRVRPTAASAPLPHHLDELMLAGFLRGEPVELVRCKTIDLEVPASAEIVLEGHVSKDDVGIEGPFGDHTGYYSHAEPFPIFRISAMTMRRDAIYASIVVGKPPAEDAWLGKATERIFLPAVKMTLPEIVDYDLPVAGAFHNCVIVSIRRRSPAMPRRSCTRSGGSGCSRSRSRSSSWTST